MIEGKAIADANSRLTAVPIGDGLLRMAASAGGALVGFYLAALAIQGRPVDHS
ncbi:MAG TPA: hypothetical protein VFU22_28765 [Roseiflexaceae bacterium]|nr:hypothetical protein [Roseiflexaceae bacterium]